MQDDNVQVVEEWERALTKRDWKRFENLHSDSVVLWAPDSQEPRKGRRAVREFYESYTNAFPDMAPNASRRFGQGEWVLAEYRVSGTHTGPLVGGGQTIPATRKKIVVPNATVYRVQAGKVTELHEYFDQLGFLTQLGVIPPPQ